MNSVTDEDQEMNSMTDQRNRQLRIITEVLKRAARGEEAGGPTFAPLDDEIRGLSDAVGQCLERIRLLEQQAKRGNALLESMDQGYMEHSLSGKVLYTNNAACRMLGYSRDELEGVSYTYYHTEETSRAMFEVYRAAYEGRLAENPFDLEITHKDGVKTHRRMYIETVRDDEGRPSYFRTFFTDTTESIKALRASEASERKLELIAANSRDIIWTMDFDFNLTYMSPSVTRVTGFTPEEVMRLPVKYIVPPDIYKDMQNILARELAIDGSGYARLDERIQIMEMPILKSDGSQFWAEISLEFNRDENGRPFEIVGVTRDITERRKMTEELRESERRFRMIVENMREVIWTADLDFKCTYVSPSCEWLTGFTPEEVMRMNTEDIVTPESFAEAIRNLKRALDIELGGKPVDSRRTTTLLQEVYCKNGGTLWMEMTATLIRNDEGRPIGILAAGRDVTARLRAEEEKAKLEEQLVQVQKMETIGRLAGGIAHDFNNMLNVILGYVDLARLRLSSQHPVMKDIEEIERAAIRSRDITTQLLAFSRRQVIEPKVIDLNDMIADIRKTLLHLIGEHIQLFLHIGENLGRIRIDPSQMEQILINLAVNARDAMPEGGTITIATDNVELDEAYGRDHLDMVPGSYVRLSVCDDGWGMDRETLKHIFEPFYTLKEREQGTGLGLATVYGIVKQNEGFINVYSEPGKGTSFNIYLPRTDEVAEGLKKEESPPEKGSGNILLVEDDDMVLDVTRSMLNELGYTVIAARNPVDAMAFYKENPSIDLVISDVIMPGMNGKDLRKELVKLDPAVKVIFISGYTTDVVARKNIIDDGADFLENPFTLRQLSRKVSEVLRKPK